jgi:hypothetical protein
MIRIIERLWNRARVMGRRSAPAPCRKAVVIGVAGENVLASAKATPWSKWPAGAEVARMAADRLLVTLKIKSGLSVPVKRARLCRGHLLKQPIRSASSNRRSSEPPNSRHIRLASCHD